MHQLRLGGKHLILLPKLNSGQLVSIARSLRGKGCAIRAGDPLFARTNEGSLRLTSAGLCQSSFDASDLLLPCLPEVLEFSKETVPLEVLSAMYFKGSLSMTSTAQRLVTRMEHSSVWDELRRTGQCALAPDVYAASLSLIRSARECQVVTDFPSDTGAPFVVGKKRYFRSKLESGEASSTLRVIGSVGQRNSYVRRDGTLGLTASQRPTDAELRDLFADIGEWCFFATDPERKL